jgi:hypothetical protein
MAKTPLALNTGERERKLLEALVLMVQHHCWRLEAGGVLDGGAMSTKENALSVLAEYGLVRLDGGGYWGRWTLVGEDFRSAAFDENADEDFRAKLPTLPSHPEPVFPHETALSASEQERPLIEAMLRMADEFTPAPRAAVAALAEYGFLEQVEPGFLSGQWTEFARKFWGFLWQREARELQEYLKNSKE